MTLFGFLNFTIIDLLDILMVAAIIFVLYKWIRTSSALNIFIAVIILMGVRLLVGALNMRMMSKLLGALFDIGAVAILVIFQPEIRKFLSRIGQTSNTKTILNKLLRKVSPDISSSDESLDEIVKACAEMSSDKVGALIVFPGNDSIDTVKASGDIVDAKVSKRLIENIFFKNSPLHDGAMIISSDRIVAARCTLPITDGHIPARYGMRHKAAVGMSEAYDAKVVVVSEQTGKISVVQKGKIEQVSEIAELKKFLQNQN